MTGKKSFIVVFGVVLIGIIIFAIVSAFTKSPLPSTETPPIITCAEQGLTIDPTDSTKCIISVATTTSTTTPPVPDPVPTPKPSSSVKFDTPLTLTTKQSLTFADGLKITLKVINDSRCPTDAQCIWAGELAPEFSVTGGSFETKVETVSLGTARTTLTTIGAYTFTLINATESTATITVSKKAVSQSKGRVTGTVTVGPICPVERVDEPCVIPPETYTSRNVVVYGPTEFIKISETPLRSDGTYTLSLAPGNYWLQIAPAGIGPGKKKPIVIEANKTVTLDFDIDSGIR